MSGPALAVLLLQPTVDDERQERVAFPWAEAHGLKIVSMTNDPWAAVSLISTKVVDVVLVTFATVETDAFAAMVASAGGRLEAVYPDRGGRTQRVARNALGALRNDVEAALRRGATPEMVAVVLGLTLEQVEGVAKVSPRDRRPEARVDPRHVRIAPVERRPAPEHPWREPESRVLGSVYPSPRERHPRAVR